MMWWSWFLFAASLALQVLVIASLRRGALKDYSVVFGYCLVLIFTTVFFLLTPVINTAIRVTEREADAFSINTAREPDGMAQVALKLGEYRKLDPSPFEEFMFFDHPSGRARIRMAMDWKAAHLPAGKTD